MGETVFPGNKSYGAIRIGAYASLVNGDIVTIGTKVYEFRTSGSPSAGHVAVAVGADGPGTASNLQAAIAANPNVPKIDAYIDAVDTKVVRLEGDDSGILGNVVFSASMTGATNIIDQTSGFLLGGEAGNLRHEDAGRYTVTALDIAAGSIMIPTKIAAPRIMSIQVYSSAGLRKYETTLWTTSSNHLLGTISGGTNPIATDIVCWSVRD